MTFGGLGLAVGFALLIAATRCATFTDRWLATCGDGGCTPSGTSCWPPPLMRPAEIRLCMGLDAAPASLNIGSQPRLCALPHAKPCKPEVLARGKFDLSLLRGQFYREARALDSRSS